MQITGTHINYYIVCQRKLWLFANGINMEHTSELVDEGRFIHETAYPQRAQKFEEVELDGVKIDFYDAKNKIVHEVKKSNKIEEAHTWQLKYYLYVLKQNGINGAKGILEYPKLRQTEKIELTEADEKYLENTKSQINQIIESEHCPERIQKKFCRSCSYYDFCWSGEED